ncbi:DEAD/DEAH box helicase [Wenzhouxiangella sp. AB-CW3]|uniref:DEAD/DEAH box helicase n=1 Tax=Wenzhouxiangella sp. AB-CW3 TaxID=2771012 RepID=UPI001CC2C6C0|nr:DEAD/DEAH box helicase [Wenzhouxiangella sp. AB-CW3]
MEQDVGFVGLGLPEGLLKAVGELGYEAPSPIQSKTIPVLMDGRDLVGQAQTGTGKTAAFALPVLARLGQAKSKPAALVLAPTRELAIQVAEAFHRYAAHLPGFHVLPIYGGQAYGPQLAGLRRGADVVVGTPGRVIDHINKGTLDLSGLGTLVLDEADEMLRMGFIDDVEQVLSRIPDSCQIALFSATMPQPIRRIAQRYLKNAEEVTIEAKTSTAASIRQRYWLVSGLHKLDALTRILEVEPFEGMIVFARTRVATEELASRLNARGFSAAALNGDVPQNQREQLVDKLRKGEIDILVATDVAARGLDVERISHVVNYDIPYDTEAYVHRIGRTGRAGRAGEAILFVAPRERGMLRAIERATRQPIEAMGVPSVADVNEQRIARFKAAVANALETEELDLYREVAQACQAETGAEMVDIAAALARLMRGGDDFLLSEREPPANFAPRPERKHEKQRRPDRSERPSRPRRSEDDQDKATFRIDVGRSHGVAPGNIVGAIANEANLDANQIGRVRIQENFSLVDLPANLDTAVFRHLARVRVGGRPLKIKPDKGPGHHPKTTDRSQTSDRPAPRGRRHTDSKDRRPSHPDKPPRRTRQESSSAPEDRERPKPKDKRPPRKARKPENQSGEAPPRKRPFQTRAQKKAGHRVRKVIKK